jgi:hypothetical protein
MSIIELEIVTVVSPVSLANSLFSTLELFGSVPRLVTELGITIDVSPLSFAKAKAPMLVTELGIVTDASAPIVSNEMAAIVVTELGIVTDVIDPIPVNALLPLPKIVIGFVPSEDGITKLLIVQEAVQPRSVPVVPLSETLKVWPDVATTDNVVAPALSIETGRTTAAMVSAIPANA